MINITDKIRVRRLDSLNLAVEVYADYTPTKGDNKGITSKKWKHYGYYGTLEQALRGCIRAALDYDIFYSDTKIQDLQHSIDLMDNARKEIIEKCSKGCLNI